MSLKKVQRCRTPPQSQWDILTLPQQPSPPLAENPSFVDFEGAEEGGLAASSSLSRRRHVSVSQDWKKPEVRIQNRNKGRLWGEVAYCPRRGCVGSILLDTRESTIWPKVQSQTGTTGAQLRNHGKLQPLLWGTEGNNIYWISTWQ